MSRYNAPKALAIAMREAQQAISEREHIIQNPSSEKLMLLYNLRMDFLEKRISLTDWRKKINIILENN